MTYQDEHDFFQSNAPNLAQRAALANLSPFSYLKATINLWSQSMSEGFVHDIMKQLEELRREAEEALVGASTRAALEEWNIAFLGRKGRVTMFLRGLGNLSPEERPQAGKAVNEMKAALEKSLEERLESFRQAEMEATLKKSKVDVTLPGRPQTIGKAHPTSTTLEEIYQIFGGMGFQVYNSPEVETDEYNFGLLN